MECHFLFLFAAKTPGEINHFLARVYSFGLSKVTNNLRSSENFIIQNQTHFSQHIANEVVHYNPSNIGLWANCFSSELSQPSLPVFPDPNFGSTSTIGLKELPLTALQLNFSSLIFQRMKREQEDSSIQLIHVMITCAGTIQRGNLSLACTLVEKLQGLLACMDSTSTIGKVASYFIDALNQRIFFNYVTFLPGNEILYHNFYEATPYLKFAYFTANQAILEAFQSHDFVHVIDFSLMQGLQWPTLIQALALHSGGPPLLRITSVGPPSTNNNDSLGEIGFKLAVFARSINVNLAFRGVVASRLDDIRPWLFQTGQGEAIAVNSILELHKLIGLNSIHRSPIELVLNRQEVDHNLAEFLDRFTEVLFYYWTKFDLLEAFSAQLEKGLAELYMKREICNILSREGPAQTERHEPLANWRD
ncbi:hypothetical protein M9H77_01875 [Catharanthus roseus]|uniref:Uncharacterized protein n=1 Tax=Catharanthus roseus TaxID=4058 RepID=A0ACC0C6Q5_CATRO|nr:hypothetical protein M9H77_01875 [Catharanthus roseus]